MSPTGDQSLASLDGEIMPAGEATIPATDEGLLRGDGAFEVIRVYDGRPFAFEEHMERLERSAANLRLPLDLELVRAEAHRLIAHAGGRLARERGFDEALFVTPHGRVLEAPTSSIFWVEGGEILTPPLSDHILASITRGHVLEVIEVRERSCTLFDLNAAEEAFIVSTTREVQSVAAIDEKVFEATGPRTQAAAAALRERIESLLAAA